MTVTKRLHDGEQEVAAHAAMGGRCQRAIGSYTIALLQQIATTLQGVELPRATPMSLLRHHDGGRAAGPW